MLLNEKHKIKFFYRPKSYEMYSVQLRILRQFEEIM